MGRNLYQEVFDRVKQAGEKEGGEERLKLLKEQARSFVWALKTGEQAERFHSHLRSLLCVETPVTPGMSEADSQCLNGLRNAYALIIEQVRLGEQLDAQGGS